MMRDYAVADVDRALVGDLDDELVVDLHDEPRAAARSASSHAATPIIASLMMSAAVPCIGALIALRSAYCRS